MIAGIRGSLVLTQRPAGRMLVSRQRTRERTVTREQRDDLMKRQRETREDDALAESAARLLRRLNEGRA